MRSRKCAPRLGLKARDAAEVGPALTKKDRGLCVFLVSL